MRLSRRLLLIFSLFNTSNNNSANLIFYSNLLWTKMIARNSKILFFNPKSMHRMDNMPIISSSPNRISKHCIRINYCNLGTFMPSNHTNKEDLMLLGQIRSLQMDWIQYQLQLAWTEHIVCKTKSRVVIIIWTTFCHKIT